MLAKIHCYSLVGYCPRTGEIGYWCLIEGDYSALRAEATATRQGLRSIRCPAILEPLVYRNERAFQAEMLTRITAARRRDEALAKVQFDLEQARGEVHGPGPTPNPKPWAELASIAYEGPRHLSRTPFVDSNGQTQIQAIRTARFDALVQVRRIREGPRRDAARLVLVEGLGISDAARRCGADPAGVSKTVKSLRDALALCERVSQA